MPWPLAVMVVSRIAGFAADRYPVGLLAGMGLATMATGLGLLAALPADPSTLDIVWRVAICGMGFGFFQTPNNRAMMTAGPKERSGAANGGMAASRTLGQTSGAAIAAVAFAWLPGHGPSMVFVIGLMFAAGGAVVSLLRLATSPSRSPEPRGG
jgi:DHA2 family multidrug resistance protein-like MFS transporter